MTTLAGYLNDAYCWHYNLDGGRVTCDPADAMAAAVASGGIKLADLQATRANLSKVEMRCVVSRVQREALDRLIARLPTTT